MGKRVHQINKALDHIHQMLKQAGAVHVVLAIDLGEKYGEDRQQFLFSVAPDAQLEEFMQQIELLNKAQQHLIADLLIQASRKWVGEEEELLNIEQPPSDEHDP